MKIETTDKPGNIPQAIRLPEDLLAHIDAYAAQLESEIHVSVSRSDAIHLVTLGLEDAEDIRDAEAALKEPGEIPLAAIKAEYGLRHRPEVQRQARARCPAIPPLESEPQRRPRRFHGLAPAPSFCLRKHDKRGEVFYIGAR